MDLIIGGAFQGKLDYARSKYGYQDGDIYICREDTPEIDFMKPCIAYLEEFTLACVRCGIDPVQYLKDHWEDGRQSTFLCMDISSGVVPIEKEMRLWRNENGKVCQYLSKEASSVVRIFCGLEQKLK